MGWSRQTIAHNAILVDGKGQGVWNREAAGSIVAFASSAEFDYVAGDATRAYQIPSAPQGRPELCASGEGVRRVVRRIVFARALRCFVVLDQIETEMPKTIQFLLHSPSRFEIDAAGRTLAVENHHAGAAIHLFEKGPVEITQTDQFSVPVDSVPDNGSEKFPNQWHLTCTFAPAASARRLLSVIIVRFKRDDAPVPAVRRLESPGWLGAAVGEATVEFDLTTSLRVRCRGREPDGRWHWFEYDG